MHKRIRTGLLLVDIIIYIFVGIIALLTLFPFIFIISASLSDPMEVVSGNIWFLPIGFSLQAYGEIFRSSIIWTAFRNSIFFTGTITILNVVNSMLAGYALSKKRLIVRKVIVIYILIPMYFSGGLIPSFIVMTKLGLYNTIGAIILPSIISIWNIILARTYICSLPDSLEEAAIIDGAGILRVFISIILPLSKPIIAVLALYTALGAWNSWFNYMIYLPGHSEWHPLQLFLTKVLIWGNSSAALSSEGEMNLALIRDKMLLAAVTAQLKYAVMIVASAPIIMIYPFVQKYFMKGALLGSLKE